MAETLLAAIGMMAAGVITGVATLLSVDKYRNKNSKKPDHPQEMQYVKLDRDDREVLLATAFSLKDIAKSLEEAIRDNRTDHQTLLHHFEEWLPK